MRQRITNLLLVAVSFFLAFALCEAVLRLYGAKLLESTYEEKIDDRQYFWSEAYVRNDESGALRAIPNSYVREVLYASGKIEFDVTFSTNNLGLIDEQDYTRLSTATRRIALVGDSFTAGTGARPWVPRLRESIQKEDPSIDVYNLGLVGTGFRHFARLVKSVNQEIPINELWVLAICDDFARTDWVPKSSAEGFWFCKQGDAGCQSSPPKIRFIGLFEPTSEIELQATNLAHLMHLSLSPSESPPPSAPWFHRLVSYSIMLTELNKVRHQVLASFREHEKFGQRIREDRPALERLAQFIGPKFFVHIPEKGETKRRAYRCSPKQTVEALGFRYLPLLHDCKIEARLYHVHDPHFSSEGAERMQVCMKNYITNNNSRIRK